MKIRDIKEYEVIKEYKIYDLNSDAYLLKHKKTGARLALLSNDDDNKVFDIAFRTPVNDDTGVPHIIEHSVLCGSKKFPLKDPFMELVKGSLNTFLNAMTYPDKTVYPVASCNDKDFQNLMDVYMDAVLNPVIYKYEEIFKQEGWHYELESEEDDMIYNGVVYNEMKGAFSSVDGVLDRQTLHSLFPDTTYGHESGGDPESIPELTYQQFLDFHSKYYHPSNSYIYLYGNMDMSEKLIWLDKEYLSKYDYLEIDSNIRLQKPFGKLVETVGYMPISDSESEEDNTILAYNTIVGTSLDKNLYQAFQVIDYALMNMPGAPLKQAIIDAGIGKDVYSAYENGILQPFYSIVAKFANTSDKEKFIETITSKLRDIVSNGIDKKSLEAGLNNMEFRYREGDYGRYPKGLILGLKMYDSWLYDENEPFMHIESNETFAYLKSKLDTDYYEKLVEKYLLSNIHSTLVILEPKKGLVAQNEKKLADKLREKQQAMTHKEIEKLIIDTKALKKYQEEPSSPEALNTIPMLEIKDIGTEPRKIKNKIGKIDGVTTILHDYFTNGIGYVTLSFDCKNVPEELIPYIGLLKSTAGYMDTQNYSFADLSNEINLNTGALNLDTSAYRDSVEKDKYSLQMEVKFKVLFEKMDKAFELAEEIMFSTKFDDYKRLGEIIDELKSKMQTVITESGDSAAALRAMSYYSEFSYVKEKYMGISYYKFIENIAKNFETLKEETARKLQLLMQYIFRKENLTISYVSQENGIEKIKPNIEHLLQKSYRGNIDSSILKSDKLIEFYPQQLNEGFKTSSQVQYVTRAGDFTMAGFKNSGALSVIRTIMSYDYLWNNIRVKGGAYGCSNQYSRQGDVIFTSYRDPNLKNTNDVFEQSPEYLKKFDASHRDMVKYIIGTISDIDVPKTPSSAGARSLAMYFSNTSMELLKKERLEILNTDVKEVRKYADFIEAALSQGNICVVGNEGNIEKDANLFKTTLPLFE